MCDYVSMSYGCRRLHPHCSEVCYLQVSKPLWLKQTCARPFATIWCIETVWAASETRLRRFGTQERNIGEQGLAVAFLKRNVE